MKKQVLVGLFLLVCALCLSSVAFAQSTGSFSGTVTDKTGGAISGATVRATSQGTAATREGITDETGHFLIPLVPVGVYTLRVEFSGFQPAETRDLRLQVDETREIDFTLVPSSVSSTVEVSAAAVAIETANPSLGQVITSQQVAQLPLNGRDFVQLATLTPGTVQETNPNSFFNGGPSSEVSARGSFSLSVGGSRANSTDWLLDGTDNNELTAGGIGILSSIDDIQEFKVLTYNYSAEYGTRGGPTVLVTTKGGSNDLHGTLYEFLRNTSLDAKSFFATSTEKFNLNQYGGSIGGPIFKNKTFWFIDGEQKSQRHGIASTGIVPTLAMRSGDFTDDPYGVPRPIGTGGVNQDGYSAITNPNVTGGPNPYFQCDGAGNPMPVAANGSQAAGVNCNKIPAALINPIAQQMINLYPLPNANNPQNAYNFVNEPVRKLDETKFDIRLDHNLTSSDTLFGRFSYDQAVSYVPGGAGDNFAEANAFASNQGLQNHGRNATIGETHIFTPTTVNQFSFGYNRIFNYITSQGTGTCQSAAFGIPGANLDCTGGLGTCVPGGVSCGLTSTQLDGGYFSLGDRGFSPFQGGTNIFTVNDSLDLIRGKHDIHVGIGMRFNQMNVLTEGFQDGYWILTGGWSGDPEGDLLMGLSSLAIHDQAFGGVTTGRRWKNFRPFGQDDWRVTKDLTLNLGLAWALVTPISEVNNRQSNFDPATGTFFVAGQGANNWAGIQFDKTALEPRIGLAYKLLGSDKTVVRAGYAIFHDSSWNQGAQGLWQNPPYYAESDRFAFSFGDGCTFATAACATLYGQTPSAISFSDGFQLFPTAPDPAHFSGTILAQNRNFKLGQIQQFNVNIERQLPGSIVLTAGYVGARSSHILVDGNNLNVTSPGACGVVPGYTLGCGPGGAPFGLPYPSFPFSTIENITDQGVSHYNGLQIKGETKSSKYGIYALIGYTYSRTYDNGFTDGVGTSVGAQYYPLPGWNKLDWALSQINLNNNFTASVIYDLPFGRGKHWGSDWSGAMNSALGGWQVTVIEHITSGFPIFIIDTNNPSGVNFENNGSDQSRPDLVANPVLPGGGAGCPNKVGTISAWFNPCAFAQPATGELGNAGRAPVNGPDFVNTDFSVIKQFALPWEGKSLNFRAEFFNLFNHAQFGLPGTDFNSPSNFGVINSTVNNPRVVQFGLKFSF
jgi:Carboxypeptidase regulatory-like domain